MAQDVVAREMAVELVVAAEVVDVDEHGCERFVRCSGVFACACQRVVERRAVRDAGEAVDLRGRFMQCAFGFALVFGFVFSSPLFVFVFDFALLFGIVAAALGKQCEREERRGECRGGQRRRLQQCGVCGDRAEHEARRGACGCGEIEARAGDAAARRSDGDRDAGQFPCGDRGLRERVRHRPEILHHVAAGDRSGVQRDEAPQRKTNAAREPDAGRECERERRQRDERERLQRGVQRLADLGRRAHDAEPRDREARLRGERGGEPAAGARAHDDREDAVDERERGERAEDRGVPPRAPGDLRELFRGEQVRRRGGADAAGFELHAVSLPRVGRQAQAQHAAGEVGGGGERAAARARADDDDRQVADEPGGADVERGVGRGTRNTARSVAGRSSDAAGASPAMGPPTRATGTSTSAAGAGTGRNEAASAARTAARRFT